MVWPKSHHRFNLCSNVEFIAKSTDLFARDEKKHQCGHNFSSITETCETTTKCCASVQANDFWYILWSNGCDRKPQKQFRTHFSINWRRIWHISSSEINLEFINVLHISPSILHIVRQKNIVGWYLWHLGTQRTNIEEYRETFVLRICPS